MDQVARAISGVDIAVIVAYFVVIVIIGVWVARKMDTGEDLFLAGRSLTWPVIGFSLFASNISSTTLIGLAGAAYASGIAVSVYEWMSGLPLLVLAFVFAPLYLKSRITTVPEFLERRFDWRSRKWFSAVTILLSILIDTAGGLYAGSVVLKTFFPDLVIWQVCVGLGIFAGLYTAAGGLAAVVYTDVLQAVVLLLGTTLMTIIMFSGLGWSWANVVAAVPNEEHLSMIRPMSDELLPWPGIVVGVTMLGFWYWVTNQYIVQRVLGAKDLRNAQYGAILGGFLKIIPLFTMVLPGAMAIIILPDLPNADMVFPTLVTTVLPVGITGLVLAGLIAAIMSSVDSTLNSASTLIVHDFVLPRRPETTPRQVGRYGRLTTLILMVLAILWAPQIANFGGLWSYLQQAFAIFVPAIAAIFLVGAFWKRGNGDGAFWALVIGNGLGLVALVGRLTGVWPVHFTIDVGILTALSALIFVVVSLRTPAPDPDVIARTTWSPALLTDPEIATPDYGTDHGVRVNPDGTAVVLIDRPWYASVRGLSAMLAGAMLLVLIGFW